MLAVARDKIAREDPDVQARITLVEGDMRDFELDTTFNFIFIATNTFAGVTRHVDFVRQTIYSRSFIDEVQPDGTVKRYLSAERDAKGHAWWDVRRYFNRFELELLIETAGFTVREVWGDYDRHPLGPENGKMIFVAVRP